MKMSTSIYGVICMRLLQSIILKMLRGYIGFLFNVILEVIEKMKFNTKWFSGDLEHSDCIRQINLRATCLEYESVLILIWKIGA